MRKFQLVVTTSGTNGSATGSATSDYPFSGRVVMVHLDYSASQANTTDVTITTSTPTVTVLSKANSATDALYVLQMASALNTDGSAVSGGVVDGVPVDGYISVTVAQGNNNETVTATIWVDER